MRWLRVTRQRLRAFWSRERMERDLAEELQAYVDERIAQGRAAGLDAAAARAAAHRDLGSGAFIAEHCREAWGVRLLDELRQDARYGARMLARQPLFALTAVLSLALCLGANTAIFTVANRLLFGAPAGVRDASALVEISPAITGRLFAEPLVAWEDYVEIRRRATRLEGVYGYEIEPRVMSLVDASGAERVFGTPVTNNYFSVLGVRPALGRLFDAGDSEEEGAAPLVVLSHRFWTQRFHTDPGILGRTIRLTRQPFTVIGVAPEAFRGVSLVVPDVWIPAGMASALAQAGPMAGGRERGQRLIVGGRLKPESTLGQAAGEMEAIGRALARERGRTEPPFIPLPRGTPGISERRSGDWALSLTAWSPIPRVMRLPAAGFISLLFALVSIVLAIACANIAGVLLARATVRRREIAVRLAIGAGRIRLIRQLLTETLLLFVLGGGLGLLVARLMTSLLVTRLPALPVPIDVSLPLDARVLLFTAALALVAAIACGLAPALRASRADVVSALKDDALAPRDPMRLRSAFVVAQVAFSLVLVASAGLFVQSLQRVTTLDQTFHPEGVEVAALDLAIGGYNEATGRAFALTLLERVRRIPGVEAATLASIVPGGGAEMFCCGVTVPGVTPPAGHDVFGSNWNAVEPGYFATLRLPIVEGRDFNEGDRESSQAVAIVDTVTAKRFWPGQSAIGRQVLWKKGANLMARGQQPTFTTQPLVVVGVVSSLGGGRRGDEPPLMIYLPLQQEYRSRLSLLARSSDGRRLAAEVRAALSSADEALPILGSRALADQAGPAAVQLRVSASVAGTVGIIGVVLAAIGLYGLTAFVVARRTREIGVRIALGAERGHVVRLVLREGLTLVALGSVIGLLLAAGAGKLLASSFFGARALDAGIFAGAAALLLLVGLVACYVPARRATQIDPITALRQE